MRNRDRLTRLRRLHRLLQAFIDHPEPVIGTVPVHFDMERWAADPDVPAVDDAGIPVRCGTSGCAFGSCTYDPWFAAQGLHLKVRSGMYGPFYVPVYRELEQIPAAMAFFGLTESEANFVFLPDCYDGRAEDIRPQAVQKRVAKLITRHAAR